MRLSGVGVKMEALPTWPFPRANFRGAIHAKETRWLGASPPTTTQRNGRKRMIKMRAAFMMLAGVIATIPVVLYAQSDAPPSDVPPSDVPKSDRTQTTGSNFTIAPDAKSGGVWRLNANTGELWFCLASAEPQCRLAVDAKKKK
jgi:hypothetical protein